MSASQNEAWPQIVEAGEWPEEFKGSNVVRDSSINFGIVKAEMNVVSVKADPGNPFPPILSPRNTLILRSSLSALFSIGMVLPASAYAQVAASVVQLISVDVVHLEAGRRSHNQAVHMDVLPLALNNCRGLGVSIGGNVPEVRGEQRVIDESGHREMAVAEINEGRIGGGV